MSSSLLGALYLQDLLVALFIAAAQILGAYLILRGPASQASALARKRIIFVTRLSVALLAIDHVFLYEPVARHLPRFWTGWARGMVLLWGVLSIVWLAIYGLTRLVNGDTARHSPARRRFLRLTQGVLCGAPVAALGYGIFIQRFQLSLREQKIVVPNLPDALHGMRLVQLTDIHMGPFLGAPELARAVAMANETKAHVALVTGDLISGPGDPLDTCIESLSHLRADLGIFGCMGNHERYAEVEARTQMQGARFGLRFLRHEAVKLTYAGDAVESCRCRLSALQPPLSDASRRTRGPCRV